MFININSKKNQSIIKIFCLLALVLLFAFSAVEVLKLLGLTNHSGAKAFSIVGIVINTISCVLCLYLFRHPKQLVLTGFIFLFYSLWIEFVDPSSFVPLFSFFLSFTFFYITGFYESHKILKYLITLMIYLGMLFSPLRLGSCFYISILSQNLAETFCSLFLIFLFLNFKETKTKIKILNLQEYQELTNRDAEWLNAILNNEKYESIAIRYKMSLGTVKNRFKVIFDALGLKGKTDFLNKYSDFFVVFN